MKNVLDVFVDKLGRKVSGLFDSPVDVLAYQSLQEAYLVYEGMAATTIFHLTHKMYDAGLRNRVSILEGLRTTGAIDGDAITEEMCENFLSGEGFRRTLVDNFAMWIYNEIGMEPESHSIISFCNGAHEDDSTDDDNHEEVFDA